MSIDPVPMLDVRGLDVHYGRIQALRAIDLHIGKGELIALVGSNGAGKSTLLRAISGIQPPSKGDILFEGKSILRMAADERVRLGISQVPEARQVFAPMSVEDNLLLGGFTRPRGESAEDLDRMYAMFPALKTKRRQAAGTLSGGQQQMLAVGRALMARPRLLLLDEPSMGLAPNLKDETFVTIERLRDEGTTVFLVEQNASSALAIADRAYVLETGRVTLSGTGQNLLGDDQVRAAYLGM
ncbi:MAG: ABC transporter ATP-binding protein [Magnetospirillum sp. WYHS-4]